MDTNALMMPVELDIRVFDELDRLFDSYELVVPEAVMAELRELSQREGTAGTAASVGLDLAERCRVVNHSSSYADDALVELADENVVDAVLTNDTPLKNRLLEQRIPVIHLRGQNQLQYTQP
ncbi:MAG: PIN domain-containing protein [Halobacteriaceae archaeon]